MEGREMTVTTRLPHILRDPRLDGVIEHLCKQWVSRDGVERIENIRIACDGYIDADGNPMPPDAEVTPEWLASCGRDQIVPRFAKSAVVQRKRTKSKAEVATPLSLVAYMVDAAEKAYLGERIDDWHARVDARSLEMTCGEGPFITSRYDPVDGRICELHERVGVLDRKLAAVAGHVVGNGDLTLRALRSTYGVEYQGDSLLLARANAYLTWYEGHVRVTSAPPAVELRCVAADIICQTITQADALTGEVPHTGALSLTSMFADDGNVEQRIAAFVDNGSTKKRRARTARRKSTRTTRKG
jgi:hypothetical protein